MARRPGSHRVLRAGPPGEALRSEPLATRRSASQAELFIDPMPARIEPCLARLVAKAPIGPNWLFELKWDGYRLAIHRNADGVRIITRGGHDWTHRFPAIAAGAASLHADSFILDGEAVVVDEHGRSDFGLLQQELGGRGGKRVTDRAILFAFDLLYVDGHNLQRMPLADRRHMLEGLLARAAGSIRLSEEVEADGSALLAHACELGLEGIIAKRRDAPYLSGRGGEWLKIKGIQSDTFLIVGNEPSAVALGGIGRLLLAAHGNYGLTYVGSVGTGFTFASATALRGRFHRVRVDKPAINLKRKGVIWVRAKLAAEIAYRGWTHDDKLRHASFKGLREKADWSQVYRLG
jgi:bifunctional non-homologous end joining protein LigD